MQLKDFVIDNKVFENEEYFGGVYNFTKHKNDFFNGYELKRLINTLEVEADKFWVRHVS